MVTVLSLEPYGASLGECSMVRLIERLRQLVPVRNMAPAVLLIINLPPHTDSTLKRPTGYAGILPVPAVSPSSNLASARLDPILEGKHDARADRGRVLYAAGHAPHDTVATLTRTPHHRPCPEQRLGEAAPRSVAPNS